MTRSRILIALWATTLAVPACGGEGGTSSTAAPATSLTTTTTLPPGTTATTAPLPTTSSTAVSTTTTTTPPTTTTTLPPAVPVVGWEGEGIRDLALIIAFNRPVPALEMEVVATGALRAMGVRVSDDADAVLAFALDGTPLSAVYGNAGRCYTGARITGTASLTAPGRPDLDARLAGEVPNPMVTFGCETDEDYAPFADAFEKGLLGAVTDLWGPAAVPFLIEVVEREVGTSYLDLALKAVAMDEFRGLDADSIALEERAAFLEAVIDTVAYLVETGHTPHGADEASRRVLTANAGTDYGISTEDDVAQWRAWLDGWVAGGGS